MYTSIYYSAELERLIFICPTDNNLVTAKALRKSNGEYGEESYDSKTIMVELVKKNYELIGNFEE